MSGTNRDEIAKAVAPIDRLTAEVRAALGAAERLMGGQTWEGASADRWYGDWHRHRQQIEKWLRDAEHERAMLLRNAGN